MHLKNKLDKKQICVKTVYVDPKKWKKLVSYAKKESTYLTNILDEAIKTFIEKKENKVKN